MASRHQMYYNKQHADYVCATAAQKADPEWMKKEAETKSREKASSRLSGQVDAAVSDVQSAVTRFPDGNNFVSRSEYQAGLDKIEQAIAKLKTVIAKVKD